MDKWASMVNPISKMCLCFCSIVQFWWDVWGQLSVCEIPSSVIYFVKCLNSPHNLIVWILSWYETWFWQCKYHFNIMEGLWVLFQKIYPCIFDVVIYKCNAIIKVRARQIRTLGNMYPMKFAQKIRFTQNSTLFIWNMHIKMFQSISNGKKINMANHAMS